MECQRYFPPSRWESYMIKMPKTVTVKVAGHSVEGRPIYALFLGSGSKKVFMWSQMHGNETTTTRALVDFIPWFLASEQANLREQLSLCIVPQLNPDGAQRYTRLNANGIDLNRDAVQLSQPESKLLRMLFDEFQPQYCLNLHGQRTIYAAGSNGKPASVSFLSPSADPERSITLARKSAMQHIVAMQNELSKTLPKGIGRYDDTFNENCVGDTFSMLNVPTILFEAGHYANDYAREKTKAFILKAYKAFCTSIVNEPADYRVSDYLKIPENKIEYVDIIVSGVTIKTADGIKKDQFLRLQYEEVLKENKIHFVPAMHSYGDSSGFKGHQNISLPSTLKNKIFEFNEGFLLEFAEFHELYLEKP